MNNRDIGRKMGDLRRTQRMTVADLADRVGLSQGQVSRLENGKQGFRSSTLLRIAEALDVKPVYFFMDDTGDNEEEEHPVYGLAAGGELAEALRSPEFVRVSEKLADAYLHRKSAFVAMKAVAEAVLR